MPSQLRLLLLLICLFGLSNRSFSQLTLGFNSNGNTAGCAPYTLTFPITNVSGNPASTNYTINFGDGSPVLNFTQASLPASVTHTYTQNSCGATFQSTNNVYGATITATSSSSPPFTVAVSPIVISLAPDAAITSVSSVVCAGSTLFLQNTSSQGVYIDPSAGYACLSNSAIHYWTITPASGWTASAASLGSTNGFPSANDFEVWSPGASPLSVTFTTPGSYRVKVWIANACGLDTISVPVCVIPPPNPQFTLNPNFGCIPPNLAVTANNSTTIASDPCNMPTYNYSWSVSPAFGWSFAGASNSSSISPSYSFSQNGNYTVTLTASTSGFSNCSVSTSRPITVNLVPTVNAGLDQSLCIGAPAIQLSGAPSGGVWSGTGVSPSGLFNPTSLGNFPLTYTFTPAAGTGCPPQSDIVAINVINPTPANAGVDLFVCPGTPSILLTATPTGGTWSGTGVTSGGSFNPSASGTFTLTYSFGTGPCAVSDQRVITVYTLPNVTVNEPAICIGQTATLTAVGSGGLGPYTYAWSPTTNLSPTTGAVVSANPSSTTNYTVTLTDANSCINADVSVVTVNPLPTVNAGSDSSVCNVPVATQLTGSPAGGTWTGPGVTSSGAFTPTALGPFVLTYSFTNANNCSSSDVLTVTVVSPSPANAGPDLSACSVAAAIQLNGLPIGGTWSGSGVSSSGLFTPSTVGPFNLTYSFGSGTCLATDVMVITVYTEPSVSVNDALLCAGSSVTLTAAGTGGLEPYTFVWSPSGGLSGNSGAVVSANPASTASYTVTLTDANTCEASAISVVTVNTVPVVNAGPNQTICLNPNPQQLNGTPAGGIWSGDNVTPTGLYTSATAGIDTLIYTISQVGCSGVDTMEIEVQAPAPLQLTPDTSVCLSSGNFQLFAAIPGGTWTSATATVSSSGVITPDAVGTFVVSYSVGGGLCTLSGSLNVTVLPLPVVDAGPDFSTCTNANSAIITGQSPLLGGTSSWSGIGITNAITGVFDPSIAGIGSQTITYTYTSNPSGCTSSDNLMATVNLLPSVTLSSATINVCLTTFGTPLTATPTGGTWSGNGLSFGNNANAQLDSAIFTPTSVGSFWVYYTFADVNGCQNIDSVAITVINPQPVNAGIDESFCFANSPYQLTGTPAGGAWISPSWLSSTGVFSGDSLGVHQAIYSSGAGSCLVRDTVQFTVNPLPIVTVSPDIEHCVDDSCYNFPSPSPVGGLWSGSGVTDATLGTFCPSITGIGASQIIYTYQNPVTTCINSDTLISVVQPLPVPGFTVVPLFCINSPSQVINNSAGPPMTFEWIVRNTLNNAVVLTTTDVSPILQIANVGDYSIEIICTSSAGCERRDTSAFSTVAPPIAAFQLLDDIVCGPIQETVTNTSSGFMISYLWDFGPSGTGSTDTIPVLPSFAAPIFADTLYNVTLSVTNICGTRIANDSVIVRPVPFAEIGTNFSQGCSPFTPVYQNASYGSPDSFLWDFGDGTSSTDSLPLPNSYAAVDSIRIFTIQLSIENTCGTANATSVIQVYPTNLSPIPPAPINGCAPFEVNFTFPLGDLSLYLWDFDDGSGMVGNSVSNIYDTPGTYQVSLIVSNFCLTDTIVTTVTVNPGPQLSFQIDQPSVCQSNEIVIQNTSSNAGGILINFGDGPQSLTGNSVSHTYDSLGVQTISLSGINPQNGCADTISQTIEVIPFPEIFVSADPDTGCVPLTVQFYNTTTFATGYEWNFSDGTGSILAEPTIVLPQSGNFIAQLIAHNFQGNGFDCPDTVEVSINVLPSPTSSFVLVNDTACGPPVNASVVNTSTGGDTYTWIWESNTSSEFEPSMQFVLNGPSEIQLLTENSFACRDTARNNFFVLGQPQIELTIEPLSGCAPHTVNFSNLTQYGDSVYWSFGDGQFSVLNSPEHVYEEAGLYSVELYVSSGDLCFDDSLLVQIIQVNPTADASLIVSPTTVAESAPVVNMVNSSLNANSFELYIEDDLISNEVPLTYTFENADTGLVRLALVANNQFNCPDTAYSDVYIIASPNIYVPSSFSPNGDGKNDGFSPSLDRNPTYYYFSIYDRWGHLVFETLKRDEQWNGTYYNVGRKSLKQDVYVYKLKAIFEQDQIYNLIGNITIVQ